MPTRNPEQERSRGSQVDSYTTELEGAEGETRDSDTLGSVDSSNMERWCTWLAENETNEKTRQLLLPENGKSMRKRN